MTTPAQVILNTARVLPTSMEVFSTEFLKQMDEFWNGIVESIKKASSSDSS